MRGVFEIKTDRCCGWGDGARDGITASDDFRRRTLDILHLLDLSLLSPVAVAGHKLVADSCGVGGAIQFEAS